MGDLFLTGNSFLCYPLLIVCNKFDVLHAECPAQVAFDLTKRQFKHAVDRNHLKRLMRESYRLQKHELYEALNQANSRIALSIMYIGKEELPYSQIYPAVSKTISKLNGQLTR